jgi:enoyl-CoA hydratase/carnithine racemase
MSSQMLTERRGPALILTLAEPATRNALSPQACAAGIEAIGGAEGDAEIRAIVLRGEGAHFCSGGNVQRLAGVRQGEPAAQAQSMERFHGLIEALRTCPTPVIAAVEGFAAGGGAALALACDLIVAAEDARFILSYAKLGLSPDGGATWHLARALPRALAQQLVWLAEPVSARQLQGWGLVHSVSDSGQALAAALELGERLAQQASNALASGKELLQAAQDRTLPEQLAAERDHFVVNLFHPNGAEGLQAFVAKRAPRFS